MEKRTVLHILNGDATLESFQSQFPEGETLVWREMLSEGKTSEPVGEAVFWEQRIGFFESVFHVQPEAYLKSVVSEFDKLRKWEEYDEIVLWFEYDLFCQINMMALLAWLAGQPLNERKVSLICPGYFPGYDKLMGLGELPPEYFPLLFHNRRPLLSEDLNFARKFWSAYCSDHPENLLETAQKATAAYPYLSQAVEAHLLRFPSLKNGLNVIEKKMLHIVHSGVRKKDAVVREMLKEENLFGFGDVQYYSYLQHLYPLLDENDEITVNPLGEKVLNGEEDFQQWTEDESFLGGSSTRDYRWDETAKRLVRK